MSTGILFIDRVCRSTASTGATGWTPGVSERKWEIVLAHIICFFVLISDKLACAGFVFYLCGSGLTQARLRSCFSGTVQQPWARAALTKCFRRLVRVKSVRLLPFTLYSQSQGDAPVGRLEWFSQWGVLSGNTVSSGDGLLVWWWDSQLELWVQQWLKSAWNRIYSPFLFL